MKKDLKVLVKFFPIYLLLLDLIFVIKDYLEMTGYCINGNIIDQMYTGFVVVSIVRYPVYYFALLMVISLLYFEIFHKCNMAEVMDAISYKKAEKYQLYSMCVCNCFMTVILEFLCLAIGFFYLHGETSLIINLAIHIFVNYFLCGMVAILLGKSISFIEQKLIKLPVIIGVLIIFTPDFQNNFLNFIKLDFSFLEILPANYQFMPDNYFLYPIQLQRVAYIFFWIFICAFIIGIKFKNQIWKQVITAMLIFCMLFLAITPRTQMSSQNIYVSENVRTYYEEGEHSDTRIERKADFLVKEYQMNLNIKNQLYAEVTVQLEQVKGKEKLAFTLYHNYDVHKVTDQNGTELQFQRKGDYMFVYPEQELTALTFQYQGTGAPLFSEYIGTYLMPGFVFFPIAGFWDLYSQEYKDLKAVVLEEDVLFDVKVSSITNGKFYSNLTEIEENHFVGESKNIFLLSGWVKEYQYESTRFLFSSFDNVDLVMSEIDKFMEKTKQENPEKYTQLENKVFVYPVGFLSFGYRAYYDDMYLCPGLHEDGFEMLFSEYMMETCK